MGNSNDKEIAVRVGGTVRKRTVEDEGNGEEKFFLMQFTCPFSLRLKVLCPLEFNKDHLHCSLASDESFSLEN